jgi:hypothetical protein
VGLPINRDRHTTEEPGNQGRREMLSRALLVIISLHRSQTTRGPSLQMQPDDYSGVVSGTQTEPRRA